MYFQCTLVLQVIMKTPLTLFVLFFSSSLFASDNLSGKELICIIDPSKVFNLGFEFYDEKKVWVHNTDITHVIMSYEYRYFALPEEISIVSNYTTYNINRKTLLLRELLNDGTDIIRATCWIHEKDRSLRSDLMEIMNTQIKELKKGNLI